MRNPEEIYQLLQIAHLSHNWQNLWPLRDRALATLDQEAKAQRELDRKEAEAKAAAEKKPEAAVSRPAMFARQPTKVEDGAKPNG